MLIHCDIVFFHMDGPKESSVTFHVDGHWMLVTDWTAMLVISSFLLVHRHSESPWGILVVSVQMLCVSEINTQWYICRVKGEVFSS